MATGGQLPACFKSNKLLEKPDAILDEIVRQSEDSMIVRMATMARLGKPLPYGNFGDVIVVNRDALSEKTFDKLLITADQILCGLNSTRKEINKRVKRLLGYDVNKLSEGEKVICHVNNWSIYLDEDDKYNLVNGTMGTVSEIITTDPKTGAGRMTIKPDFLDEESPEIVFDNKYFETGEFSYDMHQRVYLLANGGFKLKKKVDKKRQNETESEYRDRLIEEITAIRTSLKEEQIVQFSEGYCISVHKSQGSEYSNVVVIDESSRFGEPNKHLYTAITRAKEKLVIIR